MNIIIRLIDGAFQSKRYIIQRQCNLSLILCKFHGGAEEAAEEIATPMRCYKCVEGLKFDVQVFLAH